MDPVPAELLPQSDEEKFLHVAHKDRWDYLEPVIVKLYTGNYPGGGQSATLDQVVKFMKTYYSFHAAPTEYPSRFRAWNVGKRTVKIVKEDITSALGRRKRPGTSTSHIVLQQGDRGTPFDAKKLRRHLKDKKTPVEAMTPGLLSSWNLPYKAFVSSLPKNPDQPSPFGPLGATPEYLNILSPKAVTPGREVAGPSPNMELVYQKVKQDRASLFLQGRLKELVVGMCQDDRRTLIDYFHDFYVHGFVMAKNWGLAPNTSSPWTPSLLLNLPSGPSSPETSPGINISLPPTQLCRWSVHVEDVSYSPDDSVPHEAVDPGLPTESTRGSFVESLHQSMTSNSFTGTPADDLPLSQESIVRSLEVNKTALQLDAWKLAIMTGNAELLEDLYTRNDHKLPDGIDAIQPFHLAASFLDGGNTCCEMFTMLHNVFKSSYAFHHNVDNFGHTILDALIVSILRSHTSLKPEAISYGFHSPNRFPGEEKDICGRWDAETPIVRELFREGYHRIPTTWKHPFCHTAVQTVCHSIINIFGSPSSPNINALSGLFLRRCTECGMELKLGPLHTLVVTTFYLAQSGMQGETLFGALAVMTCLLAMGVDDSLKVNVSVEEILGTSEPGECHHEPLSALELMRVVPDNIIRAWSEDCQTGWICFLQALARAETEKDETPNNRSDESSTSHPRDEWDMASESGSDDSSDTQACKLDSDCHEDWLNLPCRGPVLGLLWATIQGELLTYRRVREGGAWISENFSMRALQTWLEGNSPDFMTPLVQAHMLKEHSICGWFHESEDFPCAIAQDVCVEHFMNMDIYERMSFNDRPQLLGSWEHVQYLKDKGVIFNRVGGEPVVGRFEVEDFPADASPKAFAQFSTVVLGDDGNHVQVRGAWSDLVSALGKDTWGGRSIGDGPTVGLGLIGWDSLEEAGAAYKSPEAAHALATYRSLGHTKNLMVQMQ